MDTYKAGKEVRTMFHVQHGEYYDVTWDYNKEDGTYQLFSMTPKGGNRVTAIEMFESSVGKEWEFIDYKNKKVFTVGFPDDKGKEYGHTVKVQNIKRERILKFRDVSTGIDCEMLISNKGEVRIFEVPFTVRNVEHKDKPFLKKENKKKSFPKSEINVNGEPETGNDETGNDMVEHEYRSDDYVRNSLFFKDRELEGLTEDGKYYCKVITRPSIFGDDISTAHSEFRKIDEKFTLQDLALLEEPTKQATRKELSCKLNRIMADVKALPAMGSRLDILDSFVAKIRKRKADMILRGDRDEPSDHPILGQISQDFGHMAFLGNPGTLKTNFVDVVYWALRAEGIVKGPLVRVNGREIIQGYVGQSEVAMRRKINEALHSNGVLFIDEFHALNDAGSSSKASEFGANAARELIAAMENNRDKFVVVLAGYPKQMLEAFEAIDPGLKDRLSQTIVLDDYDPEGLEEIFDYLVRDGGKRPMTIDPKAKEHLRQLIKDAYTNRDETFGNGRLMRNLANDVHTAMEQNLNAEGFYEELIDLHEQGKLTPEKKAQMEAQASHILFDDVKNISLCPLDKVDTKKNPIGFAQGFNEQSKKKQSPANKAANDNDIQKRKNERLQATRKKQKCLPAPKMK